MLRFTPQYIHSPYVRSPPLIHDAAAWRRKSLQRLVGPGILSASMQHALYTPPYSSIAQLLEMQGIFIKIR